MYKSGLVWSMLWLATSLTLYAQSADDVAGNAPRQSGVWREQREIGGQLRWINARSWNDPESGASFTIYFGENGEALPGVLQSRFAQTRPRAGMVASWAGETANPNLPAAGTPRQRRVQRPASLRQRAAGRVSRQLSLGALNPAEARQLEDARQRENSRPGRRRTVIGLTRRLPADIVFLGVGRNVTWEPAGDGGSVARVELSSAGANSIRVLWEGANLPEGLVLSVLDLAGNPAAEPLGREDLLELGEQWASSLMAAAGVLEVYLPPGIDPADNALQLNVSKLAHKLNYSTAPEPKDSYATKGEGACHNSISCDANWQDQSRSVAYMEFQVGLSWYICTGSLLNDTDPTTQKPYFLTANHCIDTQTIANTLETYWKYRPKFCGVIAYPDSDFVVKVTGGAWLRATQAAPASGYNSPGSDFTLLELKSALPVAAEPFYAGWTTSQPAYNASIIGIHHPMGSYKRISFGNRKTEYNYYWEVQWTSGVTNGGSSGSPLYNSSKQVIGQLFDGASSCSFQSGPDDYGRFDKTYPLVAAYLDMPYITAQPQGATISQNASASLSVAANGTNLSYQWYTGTPGSGTLIPGATSASYNTPPLSASGSYYVVVSNITVTPNLQVTSGVANINVIVPPAITLEPPANTEILAGESIMITAGVSGTSPSLQWFEGSTPGVGGVQVSGAGSLTLTTPTLSSSTSYWLRASNTAGTAYSQAAAVTVFANAYERWANQQGIPGIAPTEDSDLDGLSNGLEYILMLNPLQGASHNQLPLIQFAPGTGQPMVTFQIASDLPPGTLIKVNTTTGFEPWVPADFTIEGGTVTATAGAASDPARYFQIEGVLPEP